MAIIKRVLISFKIALFFLYLDSEIVVNTNKIKKTAKYIVI